MHGNNPSFRNETTIVEVLNTRINQSKEGQGGGQYSMIVERPVGLGVEPVTPENVEREPTTEKQYPNSLSKKRKPGSWRDNNTST